MIERVPRWPSVSWWLVYPGTALLLGRQLYEVTYLTWKAGPQMVGYSFVHLHPALFLFGMASYLGAYCWLLATVVLAAVRRGHLLWYHWSQLGLMSLTLATDLVPSSLWQRGIVSFFGPGS